MEARDPGGRRRALALVAEVGDGGAVAPLDGDHFLGEPVEARPPCLVWAFPYDPGLPGLTAASAGMMEPLRYRPRRRAVLRYSPGFAKVLPPGKAERAMATARRVAPPHTGLRLALPAGWGAGGALLLAPLEGSRLRDLLLEGRALPSPERLAGLPDDVAALGPLPPGRKPDHRSRATVAAELALALTPRSSESVGRVLEAVHQGMDEDSGPERLVHGDLHEAQILVAEDGTLGLVDLDALGPGDAALDAASLCAHLLVLALSAGRAAGRLLAYRSALRVAFLERLDLASPALAWREALTLLLIASGPFRVLDPNWPAKVTRRLELAAELL